MKLVYLLLYLYSLNLGFAAPTFHYELERPLSTVQTKPTRPHLTWELLGVAAGISLFMSIYSIGKKPISRRRRKSYNKKTSILPQD